MGQAVRRAYRIKCDSCAVQRSNGSADDEIRGHPSFRQGLEHPHLDGPKAAASTEDESHWPRETIFQFGGIRRAAHAAQP